MKLAAVTSLFKYYPLPEALRVIAAEGYDGVELWGGMPHAFVDDFYDNGRFDSAIASRLRRMVERSGLAPIQYLPEQCFYPVNYLVGDTPPFDGARLRARSVAYFERALTVASECGFPRMCMTTPFWGWTETETGWSHQGKQPLEPVIEVIGGLCARGAELGVDIVLEPLSFLETTGIETLDEVQALLAGVGSDRLGIMLDTGHVHVTAKALGRETNAYWQDHLDALGPRLVHIHLSDNFGDLDAHLVPGEGSFDFAHAIRALKQAGYSGHLSAELMMFGANPVPPAPAALLAQTRRFISGIDNG